MRCPGCGVGINIGTRRTPGRRRRSALAAETVCCSIAEPRITNFAAGQVNRVAWEQSDADGKGVNVASFLADFGYAIA